MCLSVPEGMLRDLVDFRIGTEISSHMPLTLTLRNIVDKEEIRDVVVLGERYRIHNI
jgi:hypothetical protein